MIFVGFVCNSDSRIWRLSFIPVTLLLITLSSSIRAQEADTVNALAGIEIETSVDRAEMYVGDLLTYTVSISYDSTYELIPPPLGANLGAFDVKDYQPDKESRLPDGRINSKTEFTLSTFTTGDYVIPPVPVLFILPDKSRKVLLAEPITIRVISLLLDANDSADIKPLKRPYEFPRERSTYYWWGGGALALIMLLALLWFLRRRKREAGEPIDNREPWEIAYERLAMLKESDLLVETKYKEYYFELTEIVRSFLGLMYKVDVLEMTTEEFLGQFATIELPHTVYNDAVAFFKHADLVKFAKLIPALRRAESDFSLANNIVETVTTDYERRLEKEMAQAGQNRGVMEREKA